MLKIIDFIGTCTLILTLILGALNLHWLIIFISALILTIVRIVYIKVEQKSESNTSQPAMPNSPQFVRYFASFFTALLMSGLAYAISLGIHYLIQMFK